MPLTIASLAAIPVIEQQQHQKHIEDKDPQNGGDSEEIKRTQNLNKKLMTIRPKK